MKCLSGTYLKTVTDKFLIRSVTLSTKDHITTVAGIREERMTDMTHAKTVEDAQTEADKKIAAINENIDALMQKNADVIHLMTTGNSKALEDAQAEVDRKIAEIHENVEALLQKNRDDINVIIDGNAKTLEDAQDMCSGSCRLCLSG